jgi:hypothetical protein
VLSTHISKLEVYYPYITGKNKFICGDSPCQEDCAIFGFLAQFHWEGFGMRGGACFKSKFKINEIIIRSNEIIIG